MKKNKTIYSIKNSLCLKMELTGLLILLIIAILLGVQLFIITKYLTFSSDIIKYIAYSLGIIIYTSILIFMLSIYKNKVKKFKYHDVYFKITKLILKENSKVKDKSLKEINYRERESLFKYIKNIIIINDNIVMGNQKFAHNLQLFNIPMYSINKEESIRSYIKNINIKAKDIGINLDNYINVMDDNKY